MAHDSKINSDEYWNFRFSNDWEVKGGPTQSQFFANLALNNLPSWLFDQIRRQTLTFVDWGCAQGDGTDRFTAMVDPTQLHGIDFSSVAIDQAKLRYPAIDFACADWLDNSDALPEYDVVMSSNTLEHFYTPFDVLNQISKRSRLATIAIVPYREIERIPEHFFTFLPENIPIELTNGFRLVWSKVVDCSKIPHTAWAGEQIFLVYAAPQWLSELKLTLKECVIELDDNNLPCEELIQTVRHHEAESNSLREELSSQQDLSLADEARIAELTQSNIRLEKAIAERQMLADEQGLVADNLASEIGEMKQRIDRSQSEVAQARSLAIIQKTELEDAHFRISQLESELRQSGVDLDEHMKRTNSVIDENVRYKAYLERLTASRSWHITKPLRSVNAKIQDTLRTADQAAYRAIKGIYWNLPKTARARLQQHRVNFVQKHLKRNFILDVTRPDAPQISLAKAQQFWIEAANAAQKVAIIPCGFEFDELVNQRPINAAKYFSANGYLVIFVAWQWHPTEKLKKGCDYVHDQVIQVPLFEFIESSNALRERSSALSIFLSTMPTKQYCDLVSELRAKRFAIIYDIMDEWEEFASVGQAPWYEKKNELQMVASADFVSCVAPSLKEKFASVRTDIEIIGNGYKPDVLGEANRNIAGAYDGNGKPIVGYFGHLTDAWFDWKLLISLARSNPETTFEIIGYGEPEAIKERLPTNVRLIGKVLPSDLGRYVKRWHAGLIPFVEGKLSRAVDPIKIYEYLYFGLPVLASGIEHLSSFPRTIVTNLERSYDDLQTTLENKADLDLVGKFLLSSSWDARFKLMLEKLHTSEGIFRLYAK